jgi:hypothetical protein
MPANSVEEEGTTGDAVVVVVGSFYIRFLRLLKAFWNILMMSRVR